MSSTNETNDGINADLHAHVALTKRLTGRFGEGAVRELFELSEQASDFVSERLGEIIEDIESVSEEDQEELIFYVLRLALPTLAAKKTKAA